MPKRPWTLIALSACAAMTVACATSAAPTVDPPQLELASSVVAPCQLPVLPTKATAADLEVVYVKRGDAIVACDEARAAAVETLQAERELVRRWLLNLRPD